MSFGRRGFLTSLAAGSTAALIGCDTSTPTPDPTDCGVPAPPPDAGPACPPLSPPDPSPDLDYPSAGYFAGISAELDAAGIGTPVVILDMDRVDSNIDAIVAGIPDPLSYRIVEKSLPSLDLLDYVSTRSGSDRFMVLHLPFLTQLLAARPTAEVLVGKSHLTGAIRTFFATQPPGTDLADIASRVIFIADTPTRLDELVALAGELSLTLRLAVEIDVGLRRSGIQDPSELSPMLDVFLGTAAVEFAGMLGYDGHIAFNPRGSREALDEAWAESTAIYQSFVDVLNGPGYEALAGLPGLVFNSGGSSTFSMYASGTPVNDVAAGGGVLRPGAYPEHVTGDLRPAIFIATPVFRVYPTPQLPFFTPEQSASFLSGLQGLTIYGGGWPAFYTYPEGIQPAPFVSDATDVNMVPNQGVVMAPEELSIAPGDWVFYHPRQSDALFQFEEILQVRGGSLSGERFTPYPRRF